MSNFFASHFSFIIRLLIGLILSVLINETFVSSEDYLTSNDSVEAEDQVTIGPGTEETEDNESSDVAEGFEIPEYLRAGADNSFSILSHFGLVETLFPDYGLEKALGPGRDDVLNDIESRIADDFKIPGELRNRVGFWFDIYTKYDSNRRVIHHSRYPWVIYKVVDVSLIINSDTPSRLWMRRDRANKIIKAELHKVRTSLTRLATRKDWSKLSDSDRDVASALRSLGGNIRAQVALARRSVRVQTGQKDFFVEGLQISSRYLKTMEQIFAAHGLPTELTRIPLVESSFNRHATSRVGASGIWQFMGGTGRKFMLVDGAIDERRSPFKASEAAARLLKENHLILHRSWPLAVTAWNHGPSGVRRAVAKAQSLELAKIVARYRSRSFDFASSNFYSEFLAALHAEKYSDALFGGLERLPHDELKVVKLARAIRFRALLRVSGMTTEEFVSINPELVNAAKKNLLLPRGFRLHVPTSSLENFDRLFAENKEKVRKSS